MKKNIGQVSALYPVPVVVVGAMNGNEPHLDARGAHGESPVTIG